MRQVFFTGMFLLSAALAAGAVIHVDPNGTGDYPTIQAAIDAADPNDIILLADGTYTGEGNRDLVIFNKSLMIRSENGPWNCMINCQGYSGILIESSALYSSICVLDGLTITNASGYYGSAIHVMPNDCEGLTTIRNCILTENVCAQGPGAISGYLYFDFGGFICWPRFTIENCIISNNQGRRGGGIGYGRGSITNCEITNNTILHPYGNGGGISQFEGFIVNCLIADNQVEGYGGGLSGIDGTITNCTISGNQANTGMGGLSSCEGTIENSIVWNNDPLDFSSNEMIVRYSCLEEPVEGEGNIYTDPQFDAVDHYRLTSESPCVNAGDPNYVALPNDKDIDGQPRIMDGRVDIGADEFPSDEPFFAYWPESLYFHAKAARSNPAPQILQLWNAGPGTLQWGIGEDCPWLTVSPLSGITSSEPNLIIFDVNIAGLEAGDYSSELLISDPNAINSPLVVPIYLNVRGPVIEVSQNEFFFSAYPDGPNPVDQTLSIRNAGGETLYWQISESCDWLEVWPLSGSSYDQWNDVMLRVNNSGLPGGNYVCSVRVSDPNAANSPKTVTVNLTVVGPIFELSQSVFTITALEDGPDPADQVLTITNAGEGTLLWTLEEESCSWLSVDKTAGALPAGISEDMLLDIDITGLDSGNYSCLLTLTDPNTENSPQEVTVNLTVVGPVLEVSPTAVFFETLSEGVNPSDQILSVWNGGGGMLNWQIAEDCSWLQVNPLSGSSTGETTDVLLHVDVNDLEFLKSYSAAFTVSAASAENSPQSITVGLKYGECYAGMADYDQWVAVGSPECWCYPRQCHGDADGYSQGSLQRTYVFTNDLTVLVYAYGVKEPPKGPGIQTINVGIYGPGACADFDHQAQGSPLAGYTRVFTNDLNILAAHYGIKEPPKGPGIPADCLPGNVVP